MNFQVKNLKQLLQKFSDDSVCRKFLEETLWKGVPTCPKCGCQKSYKLNDGKTYKCANNQCYKKYTVTVGTVFENTNIGLSTWFAAMYLCTAHKKGVSSLQLSRDLSITQKTAWFLLHRIREMMKEKAPHLLRNFVQVDETYIGGKETNKHFGKKEKIGRGPSGKIPVVGLMEEDGNVKACVMTSVSKENIQATINKSIEKDSIVITDGYHVYTHLGDSPDYKHIVVNHTAGEYVTQSGFHTNSIEGFFGMLKRGIYGIYHQVSPKHLHRYCEEFSYRYNTRKNADAERFVLSMQNASGRLTYKQLISK